MLVILCTGLPITTTTAGEWLNILIFYNYSKCITACIISLYITESQNSQTFSHKHCGNQHIVEVFFLKRFLIYIMFIDISIKFHYELC